MAQKPVLGKGLASLFPNATTSRTIEDSVSQKEVSQAEVKEKDRPAGAVAAGPAVPATATPLPQETANRDRHLGISMASLEDIRANHRQPRRDFDDQALKELADSIKISGIIQPLVVRKGAKEGFELIAGERRLRAAKLAGLKQVPIVIRRSTDRESLELALVENIQRQNLNCVDEALAYFQLIEDFSLTQEEVADRVGKERATVANYLRLLRLPEVILDDLKKQLLTFGHGKALLGVDDPEIRLRVRAQVLEKHLSVRETEALVEEFKQVKNQTGGAKAETEPATPVQSRLGNLSRELARQWSTKVEIKGTERKGKIVFHYSSRQDLDRIIEAMQTD